MNTIELASQNKWQVESSWPNPVEGFRSRSAMVVVSPKNKTALVMLGGDAEHEPTDTVHFMDLPTEEIGWIKPGPPMHRRGNYRAEWSQGPPMNRPRHDFDAVVCNGAVYAIGGCTSVVERISIHHLLKEPNTYETDNATESWCDLSCQFAALTNTEGSTSVVKDRYIVVTTYQKQLGMIQVLDTGDPDNHVLTTFDAPSRAHIPRRYFTSVAVENKVYIIGGEELSNDNGIESVECIEFSWNDSSIDDQTKLETGSESSYHKLSPQILSWTVETDLFLLHARRCHSSVVLGSKIVLAGGWDRNGKWIRSIEVIDVKRKEMSAFLPDMLKSKCGQLVLDLPESGRLLAVDRFNGKVQSLQYVGDLVLHKVRPSAQEIDISQRFAYFKTGLYQRTSFSYCFLPTAEYVIRDQAFL